MNERHHERLGCLFLGVLLGLLVIVLIVASLLVIQLLNLHIG